jgi:hypothetical protein
MGAKVVRVVKGKWANCARVDHSLPYSMERLH